MHLDLTTRPDPDHADAVLVTAAGEVDLATAPALRQALNDAADTTAHVTADLRAVTFLDSTGLGVLIATHRRLADADGQLVIRCANDRVLRVFLITGLDDVLTVVD